MGNTVCVRIPNWVGDVVMATPCLRAIRENLPSSRIVGVVASSVKNVLRNTPWIDQLITYRRNDTWGCSAAMEFMRCVEAIRQHKPDLGFVLPNSFSSALMLRMAGVDLTIGYQRDARSLLLSTSIPRPQNTDGTFRPIYMGEYYLALCEHFGFDISSRKTDLPYSSKDISAVESILRDRGINADRPLFLFHATAGYGPSKLWSQAKFGSLATMLQSEFDALICGIGAPAAHESIERINAQSPVVIHNLSDCGIDLHLLKALVAKSDLLVSTDSGPRHYGVALGTPTVCIMGPTDPAYSTSQRTNDHVVRVDVDCGPCQEKHCKRDHKCMSRIRPEMVFSACCQALEGNPNDRN